MSSAWAMICSKESMEIKFNENNINEIKSVIKKLVNLKNKLHGDSQGNAKIAKKLESQQRLLESFNKILESDISDIYGHEVTGDHYVYFHCDPNTPIIATKDAKNLFSAQIGLKFKPFYVGKGIGNRCYETNRNDSYSKKKQQITKTGKEIVIVKVKESLSENLAFALESKYIDIFGLIAHNQFNWLLNLDEGKHKEERRDKYLKGSNFALRNNKIILS